MVHFQRIEQKATNMIFRLAARAFLLLQIAIAVKDDSYFPSAIVNPNLKYSHYWHDAFNVLQDLSQFEKLYIKFHHCVWSPMEPAFNYNGQEGGENRNNYCPGDVSNDGGRGADEDGDAWYLGAGPCYRANAGITLYGILDGRRDTGCNQHTYINSFVTTSGLDTFLQALYSAGESDLISFLGTQNDQKQSSAAISSYCFSSNDDTSYTTGCLNSKFVKQSFSGSTCNGRKLVDDRVDDLVDFNEALDSMECIPIYQKTGFITQNGNGNNRNGDNNGNNVSPLAVLRNIRACNPHDPLVSCPDPYGKVATYSDRVERALGIKSSNSATIMTHNIISLVILSLGLLFILGAVIRCRNPVRARRKYHTLGCDCCYKINVSYLTLFSRCRRKGENDDDDDLSISTAGNSDGSEFPIPECDEQHDQQSLSSTRTTMSIERGSDPPATASWFKLTE